MRSTLCRQTSSIMQIKSENKVEVWTSLSYATSLIRHASSTNFVISKWLRNRGGNLRTARHFMTAVIRATNFKIWRNGVKLKRQTVFV